STNFNHVLILIYHNLLKTLDISAYTKKISRAMQQRRLIPYLCNYNALKRCKCSFTGISSLSTESIRAYGDGDILIFEIKSDIASLSAWASICTEPSDLFQTFP